MQRIVDDLGNGIVRVTTPDERFYLKTVKDDEGIPKISYVPSVTWIAGSYPKGIAFYKWLAQKGWNEAEAIKVAAGDKGSKVHQAIETLLSGNQVAMDAQFLNKDIEKDEELKVEEYECLMAFANWFKTTHPKTLANETIVFNDRYNYAGTVDWIGWIGKKLFILDFKTSKSIWPEHIIQLSAYSRADIDCKELEVTKKEWDERHLGILQLGYNRNKTGYKFTEIEDKFDLFLAARKIWEADYATVQPKQTDYPKFINLFEKGESDA